MLLRYLLAWIPMVLLAIVNGALRQYTYGKRLSEHSAHQLSSVTGIALFGIYIGFLAHIWPLPSARVAITIGLSWLGLTVAFEFLFGRFVAGHSWARLVQDYNLLAGRLWILVLIWVAFAPLVFYHLRP
jgi:hypothetical protein